MYNASGVRRDEKRSTVTMKMDNASSAVEISKIFMVKFVSVQSDNVRDHRAGTEIMQAENSTRKSGFACITLLFRG